jgi:hypothetical protein
MAHPLTHVTHGIPTRRPFHAAKTASRPWVARGKTSACGLRAKPLALLEQIWIKID